RPALSSDQASELSLDQVLQHRLVEQQVDPLEPGPCEVSLYSLETTLFVATVNQMAPALAPQRRDVRSAAS
ncbi:MAG: hypothetical protein RLO21_13835, partial [Nitratireductor sp.]